MDPFVRGLLFYYGLEFHDLAPESILHISSFIVVCEAFLRVSSLRIMAQDFWSGAEDDQGTVRRVRRRCHK